MKKKKVVAIIIILIIAIILAAVAGVVIIQKNRNTSNREEVESDTNIIEKINNIEGKYTDTKITDMKTALNSLENAKEDINIKDINNEIKEIGSDTSNSLINTYSFKQYYNGIEVYGNTITIYTDKNGNAQGIINKFVPLAEKQIQTVSKTKYEDIIEVANARMKELNIENFKISSNSLVLFPVDEENYRLAHKLNIQTVLMPIEMIIDDENKEILAENSQISSAKTTKENLTQEDINQYKIAGSEKYELVDKERNIKVEYDKDAKENEYYPLTWSNLEEANKLDTSIGIKSLKTLQNVYDYFYKELGVKYITGKKETSLIHLVVSAKNRNGIVIRNNAFFTPNPEENDSYIVLGEDNLYNEDIEVIAHEYSHGIFDYTTLVLSGGEYKTKAINEAYADILGMCAESYSKQSQRIDGIINGVNRDIKNSKVEYKNLPKNQKEYEQNKRNDSNKDEHYYSQILSRAAYLMSENIQLNEFKKLWYNSISLLPKGKCNYYDCEYAVLKTAEIMGFTQDQQKEIIRAFENVGIVNYDLITKDIKDYADKTWNNQKEENNKPQEETNKPQEENTNKDTVKLSLTYKYSDGVAWARGTNKEVYLLDEKGNILYETTAAWTIADSLKDFKDGYAQIIDDNGKRIIDKTGKTIIEAKDYEGISYKDSGLALITIREETYQKSIKKMGIMNLKTKEYTFGPKEDVDITELGEGMFRVYGNSEEMLVNGVTGKSAVEKNSLYTLANVMLFNDGYGGARIYNGTEAYIWDKNLNKKIIKLQESDHSNNLKYSEKLFFSGNSFYDLNGNKAIDLSDGTTIRGIGVFKNGHALLKFYNGSKNFFTVIDKSGRFLFEPMQYISSRNVVDTDSFALYDEQDELYGEGYILCRENSKWKVLDTNGKIVLQLEAGETPIDAIGENGMLALKNSKESYYKTIKGEKILASKKQ